MQESTKKKRLIVLIISIIIALSIALFFYAKKYPNSNIEIPELVAKYNQNCPLIIQEGIRLDSVTLPEERVVQYNLTLVNVEKEAAEIEIIKENIEQSLVSTAKANPGLKEFRNHSYTLVYSYSDKKKVYLFKVKIAPEKYK